MAMKVDIIKANTSLTDRRRKTVIDRKRVAAYCRVSTDSEDQLHSYRPQVDYYTKMITNEKDWMMAGVYADATVIIGLKQNPTNGRRFSPIFLLYRAFCGAKRRMPL